MRLLARGVADGDGRGHPAFTTTLELWDQGSTAPADLILQITGGGDLMGTGETVPAGDPPVISMTTVLEAPHRLVITRSDVASVRLEHDGVTDAAVPVAAGYSEVLSHGDGPHPTWLVEGLSATGALLGATAYENSQPAAGSIPRDLCADPVAEGQRIYLDWPCAMPADGNTEKRVDALVTTLLEGYPSIKTPHVRLLADTLDSGDAGIGLSFTEIEVWDPADPRSAVLTGTLDSAAFFVPANDPAIDVGNTSLIEGTSTATPVFARSDIATLALVSNGTSSRVPVRGGLAILHAPSMSDTSTETVTGFDAAGRQVASEPFHLDGCLKAQTTPCNPSATPSPRPPRS